MIASRGEGHMQSSRLLVFVLVLVLGMACGHGGGVAPRPSSTLPIASPFARAMQRDAPEVSGIPGTITRFQLGELPQQIAVGEGAAFTILGVHRPYELTRVDAH